MPLDQIRVDPDAFPLEDLPCLRCGKTAPMRFVGPCAECVTELRAKMRVEVREVETEYVPQMNVTVNAVALKDD